MFDFKYATSSYASAIARQLRRLADECEKRNPVELADEIADLAVIVRREI